MSRCETTVKSIELYNKRIHQLLDDIQQLLHGLGNEGEREATLSKMNKILDYLAAQFELEEKDGYLAHVLEEFPNWHPQLQHLQQEHRLLHQQFGEIRDRLSATAENSNIASELRRHLSDWIASFQQHQQREDDLLHEAFVLDVGQGE